jgi:hypothetical protein
MPAHRTKRHAAVVSAAVTRLLVTRVSKVGGIRPGLGAPRRSRTKAKAKATTTTNGSNKTNKARMILSPRRGGYVFDLTRSEATTVPSSWPTSLNSRTTSIRGSVSPAPSFHTARDRTPRDSPDVIPETSKGAIGVSVRAAPSVVCPPPPPRPQQPQPHRRRAPALPRKSKTLPKLRQRHSSTVDSDICAVESVERLLCPLTRAVLVDGVRGWVSPSTNWY